MAPLAKQVKPVAAAVPAVLPSPAPPLSRVYRHEDQYAPGAVIQPRAQILQLPISPALSRHRLHFIWLVRYTVNDEYFFKAVLRFVRNNTTVLSLPMETHARSVTTSAAPAFAWSIGAAGLGVASNPCQCQYVDPMTSLTNTVAVPGWEFDLEADQVEIDIERNDTISGTGIDALWFSFLLLSTKP